MNMQYSQEIFNETNRNLVVQNNVFFLNCVEGLTLSNEEGTEWAVLLRDASSPGKVRYQLFDQEGLGKHVTFESFEQAFEDALKQGFCRLDMGALDRQFACSTWVHANA